MGFYDIETGQSGLAHGFDRGKDDRAALAAKLKAKLRELRACGLAVEFEDDAAESPRWPQPNGPEIRRA